MLLTDNTESLRAAALAGLGLPAVPNWAVSDVLASGQLRQVLAEEETPTSGIFAVYPSNRLMTPKVSAFVDHLATGLRARGLAARGKQPANRRSRPAFALLWPTIGWIS